MKRGKDGPAPSREAGRVWLLVIAMSFLGLALVSVAVSRSFAASAHMLSAQQHGEAPGS